MSISTFTTIYSLAVRVFVSLRLVTVLTCSYHRLLVLMYDRNVVSLVPINSCNSVLLSVSPFYPHSSSFVPLFIIFYSFTFLPSISNIPISALSFRIVTP